MYKKEKKNKALNEFDSKRYLILQLALAGGSSSVSTGNQSRTGNIITTDLKIQNESS